MKNAKTKFAVFTEALSPAENELLLQFFSEFDTHFLVSKKARKQFKNDFETAIMYRDKIKQLEEVYIKA